MIMLCLLPESDDISVSIHHKLIEAYCWENDIIVIKVCFAFNFRISILKSVVVHRVMHAYI